MARVGPIAAIASFIILGGVQLHAVDAYSCSYTKMQHPRFDGNLVQGLVYLEHATGCPLIAEVVKPFPLKITLPQGSRTIRDDIDLLRPQLPKYDFTEHDGVILIREHVLQSSPNNPMNQKIGPYQMPETLSDLKLSLPSFISSAATGLGGLLNGIGLPPEDNVALKPAIVNGLTAEEILIRAFHDISVGFSLIIFKSNHPNKNASDTSQDWFLVGGKSIRTFQIVRNDLEVR